MIDESEIKNRFFIASISFTGSADLKLTLKHLKNSSSLLYCEIIDADWLWFDVKFEAFLAGIISFVSNISLRLYIYAIFKQ